MRRSFRWFGLVVALVLMAVWLWWSKPRDPGILIGSPRADIRWIGFLEAHPKKLISFTWPTGTPYAYPRHGLPGDEESLEEGHHAPGIAESAARDDPEYVAGYFLIRADTASLHRDLDIEVPGYSKDKGTVLVTVGYALSAESRQAQLVIGNEKVDVVLPFDPTKSAARFKPMVIQAGPYKLRFEFDNESTAVPFLSMKVMNAPVRQTFLIEYDYGSSGGWQEFCLQATRLSSGDLYFRGSISPAADPEYVPVPGKTYRFSVVLRKGTVSKHPAK